MTTNELFPLHTGQPKAKDLRMILSNYSRYWYLFLFGLIIALTSAFIYLRYYAISEYEITSTLLINDKNNSVLSGGSKVEGIGIAEPSKDINNEIEILKSNSLAQRVVNELSLLNTYHIKGRVKDLEVYGKSSPINIIISSLDSSAYNKALTVHLKPNSSFDLQEGEGENKTKPVTYQLGQLIHKPYGTFTVLAAPLASINSKLFSKDIIVHFQDAQSVAKHISSTIKIAPINKDATVLMVSLIDAVPERGKDIINKLIEIYDEEAVEYKNRNAASSISFLDERLKFITAELAGVEKNVEQYKKQNQVADVSSQATNYIEQASVYNKQLADWATQIDVLESIEKYLNKSSGQYTMVPSSLGIQDPTLLGLIEKFNSLQLERERMLRTTETNNPLVQNLNEQLANLRTNILENLQNIKKGLIITSRNLKTSSGQFQTQIKKVPSIERELLEINRQQVIKQALYSFLLQKKEEASLELAATVSNSRIIDPAISTDYPISPQKPVIYLIALLLGLSVPFASIYVKNMMNDKIQNISDIENITNTPILGELVLSNNREKIVVTQNNRSVIAEMFRLVRANFNFITLNKPNKVILITSSMSGEGKTFFSLNFAASLLLLEKKVVLLELDLRNSDLSHVLGMQDGLGITDYLTSNDVFLGDIVRQSEKIPGLHVISSGPTPINPSELMMSHKLSYLISELREVFDYIILDTAPVGKVSDVFSLSQFIDASIYLVRCNYTFKKMINIIDSIYKSNKLSNPMIVVNAAKSEDSNSYGYGYEQKKKKHSVFKLSAK